MSDEQLGNLLLGFFKAAFTPANFRGATFGIWLLVVGAYLALYLLIYGQIVKRAGFSRMWAFITLVPMVGSLATMAFAIMPWPNDSGRGASKPTRRKRRRR